MAQTVLITLTTAGSDTGPFDLYSNVDGFTIPFESNIAKLDLEAGYVSSLVPDVTDIVRVKSDNVLCDSFVDLIIMTPTTTSTSSTTTTTSTTTINCGDCYTVTNGIEASTDAIIQYTDCSGSIDSFPLGPGGLNTFCSQTLPICTTDCDDIDITLDPGACDSLC